MNADAFPDFLGIGAPKTASSWLSANLRRHPEVWVAPCKEVHYFDRELAYPSPSLLATDKLAGRLLGRQPHNVLWRRHLRKRIGAAFRERDVQRVAWDWRFFVGTYDDRWYASLFRPGRGKVKGEITPAYALLDPRVVEHVATIMPEVKLIYTVRNPVEQTWSWLAHEARLQGDRLDCRPVDELLRASDAPGVRLRSDYLRTMETWRRFFPEHQFMVGFRDDIEHDPEAFLFQVFGFLGVDASAKSLTPMVRERINAHPGDDVMPHDFRRRLTCKRLDQFKALAGALGGRADQWLADAERIAAEG